MVDCLTFTLPIRLAIDDATSIEAAATILDMKNIVPSWPSGRLNLRRKKYVIQDLDSRQRLEMQAIHGSS